MVEHHEHLAPARELTFGESANEERANVNKELKDLKMEGGASTETDVAVLTVPSQLGKKLVPYQHLSYPHRIYSLGSEQNEKRQQTEVVSLQAQRASNSEHSAMETDQKDKKAPAEAFHSMSMGTTTETDDEADQFGKERLRCDAENLDSSPDNGHREIFQGNSRHICKYCAKDFSSGRALGGHMRAHGSLIIEEGSTWTPNADCVEKQQLSGSTGHASFWFNMDGGNDHTLSNSVMREGGPPTQPKRSHNIGKEILYGRPGGRRSKYSDKQREIKTTEDVDGKEENAAAPMTEPEPSISSDDDFNVEGPNEDGITDDAASNVCNVCDREFENPKQLNSHKKSHGLYALRRNPKRSRRFIDQDYTADASATTLPTKKTSSIFTADGNMHACTECGKRFQSWKALFGHMRCHPERNWRGIHRPDVAKDKQGGTVSAERQLRLLRRKEATCPNSASQESDSEFEAEALGTTEPTGGGRAAAATSDNESDTESIEAAYMNGDRQPSTSTWIWMTGKRSKRSRQTVRSLQAVTKTAAVPLVSPAEDEMEHETAMGLMMLARKEGGKENWLERKSCELAAEETQGNVSSEPERDELDVHLDNEKTKDSEEEEIARKDFVENNKGKGKLDGVDNASLCEENEEGDDDFEAGEQGVGSAKPKYVCNTCKRVFKSHQALGGHRASHKKVKGCFARTNVNDGGQESPDEDMISEEFPRSDDQLPTELNGLSQSESEEKERQFSAISKEDSGEVMNRNKSKGHVCTICGRVFNSGQALGGHKRCHYNTKEATSSEATSSTNNTIKQSAAVAQHQGAGEQHNIYKNELGQQGSPGRVVEPVQVQQGKSVMEEFIKPAARVRAVKEKFLDLNLPAPVNDDDLDLEAYEMPPTGLMCVPLLAKKIELKGTGDFPSTTGIAMSTNFEAELETSKPNEEYFPLYHTGKYASLVDENNQDLSGGPDSGFRGSEVEFSLRYVRCNICDRQFSTVEALGNHEKTHACIMSSVSGLTPISA